MENRETILDNLFQEFLSSFDKATPEEKRRLAAQFYSRTEQPADSAENLTPNDHTQGFRDDHPHSSRKPPEIFPSESHQDAILHNLQSLVESETHLKQITDNLEQVFWLSDIDSGCILYISPAFEVVWGRSRASLYADPMVLIESVHPEDRVQVMVASSHDNQKPFDQTYRILRPDGSLRWIFARLFSTRNENGKPGYLFCIAQDITDQNRSSRCCARPWTALVNNLSSAIK